ncbi:hypothetical protein [Kordiimonas sp. SCSIO 12610]|uniref:hypothetical protein n=1 Tax=Kordiimonas sp. SCSIO 12610 TaxID=2829597 RepID=UPI002108F85B|nr:hypothetical protein [Kordiimonas sp. SCSIO 12610]UTW53974.1 hypothetical protein KFF44_08980 [Kordiimonas sp. SCSIO 12610]
MALKVNVFRPQSGGTGGTGVDLDAIFNDFNAEFFPDRVASAPVSFNPDPSVLAGIADINAGIAANASASNAFGRGVQINTILVFLLVAGGTLLITKAVT